MEESIMTERFMVDDCGTLIDMTNRNTYDYVSDVCDLLNELHEENQTLKKDIKQIHTYIDNAILTERTRMGKNCLKQLKEGLQ